MRKWISLRHGGEHCDNPVPCWACIGTFKSALQLFSEHLPPLDLLGLASSPEYLRVIAATHPSAMVPHMSRPHGQSRGRPAGAWLTELVHRAEPLLDAAYFAGTEHAEGVRGVRGVL